MKHNTQKEHTTTAVGHLGHNKLIISTSVLNLYSHPQKCGNHERWQAHTLGSGSYTPLNLYSNIPSCNKGVILRGTTLGTSDRTANTSHKLIQTNQQVYQNTSKRT